MREYEFLLTRILPFKDRSTILPLYEGIRVTEDPHSHIFYAVHIKS